MNVDIQKFMNEQTQALGHQARMFRRNPVRFMRKALLDSAEGLKSLKSPVRVVAHSGVKITVVSGNALQRLIELESEIVTAALSGAATRLERTVEADGVADLVLDQVEMLGATRERVTDEATRAVEIVASAGHDIRKLATHAYESVVKAREGKPARTTRAPKPATRKVAVRSRKKVAKRAPPASQWVM